MIVLVDVRPPLLYAGSWSVSTAGPVPYLAIAHPIATNQAVLFNITIPKAKPVRAPSAKAPTPKAPPGGLQLGPMRVVVWSGVKDNAFKAHRTLYATDALLGRNGNVLANLHPFSESDALASSGYVVNVRAST